MNSPSTYSLISLALFLNLSAVAQLPSNRIRPGTMYYPGDTVRSPRLGVEAIIPSGWEGVLPRDAEVFLLMSAENVNGQIYVGVNENLDQQGQIARWKQGMDLGEGLRLMPGSEITFRDKAISGTGKVVGKNANATNRIYLEAICSPHGFCLSYMLMADAGSYEKVKDALQAFVDRTTFTKPTMESPYLHFNWKKFLSGKVLLLIDYEQTSKKEDEVHLCSNGSFTSTITRRGVFKELAKGYQGHKKGTWSVRNNGDKAIVTFSLEKLPPIDLTLEVRDDKIYINGIRYFVGNSEKCQ